MQWTAKGVDQATDQAQTRLYAWPDIRATACSLVCHAPSRSEFAGEAGCSGVSS
jgi:hypothetical protein